MEVEFSAQAKDKRLNRAVAHFDRRRGRPCGKSLRADRGLGLTGFAGGSFLPDVLSTLLG